MINEKDEYSKVARTYPSLIILAWCFVFLMIIARNNVSELMALYKKYGTFVVGIFENELLIKLAKLIPITALLIAFTNALFFFIKIVIREIGKIFPEAFIAKFWKIPTTRILCNDCTVYTEETKLQIITKIDSVYKKNLLDIDNKSKKNDYYIKEIESAVGLIRESTRDNQILYQFNKTYGFWRNLTGGFVLLLLIISLFGVFDLFDKKIILLYKKQYLSISVLLILHVLFSIFFTMQNGIRYAKQLYTAFLSK